MSDGLSWPVGAATYVATGGKPKLSPQTNSAVSKEARREPGR